MQIYNDKENNRVYQIDKTKLGAVIEPLETGIGTRYNLDIKDNKKPLLRAFLLVNNKIILWSLI